MFYKNNYNNKTPLDYRVECLNKTLDAQLNTFYVISNNSFLQQVSRV